MFCILASVSCCLGCTVHILLSAQPVTSVFLVAHSVPCHVSTSSSHLLLQIGTLYWSKLGFGIWQRKSCVASVVETGACAVLVLVWIVIFALSTHVNSIAACTTHTYKSCLRCSRIKSCLCCRPTSCLWSALGQIFLYDSLGCV